MTTMTIGRESHDGKLYLTCAETAKLVRNALKKTFPGVKFSVRSSVYSGGASIHIRWTDGPTEKSVRKVTDGFSGAGFDGMIDLKYYVESWLMPDGTVELAHRPSTTGSVTSIVNDPPSPNARLAHFGADYVFADRDTSLELTEAVLATFEGKLGYDLPRMTEENKWWFWSLPVPLAVDRTSGELYRMVDTEKTGLGEVFRAYVWFRDASAMLAKEA